MTLCLIAVYLFIPGSSQTDNPKAKGRWEANQRGPKVRGESRDVSNHHVRTPVYFQVRTLGSLRGVGRPVPSGTPTMMGATTDISAGMPNSSLVL